MYHCEREATYTSKTGSKHCWTHQIAFNCDGCDKPIIRDSEEHDNCNCDDEGDKWYCEDCGVPVVSVEMPPKKKLKLKVKVQQCAKCLVEYRTDCLVICDPCGGTFCEDCQDQEMCHDCFEEAICCKDKIDELNERHDEEINALKKEIAELKNEIAELKPPKKRSPLEAMGLISPKTTC
jgi:hypothetical protein